MKNYLIAIATMAVGIGNSCPTLAQITPDPSLGSESSVVTPGVEVKGETADRIDGGAIRDRNLFHSFDEFNVEAAQRVYFANPENIEQIFTRVTGNNPSNINGTLGVDGAADLLLLNPNGIIFGENSSLDLEGSFFGTSADSVLFEDDTEFSAVQPNSLLTISVPVGLQMGNNPGNIEVRSPLTIADGQNFSLVGGQINLTGNDVNIDEDGVNIPADGIIAPEGRVELGGLSTAGIVSFESSNRLVFPENLTRADVSLNNYLINVSAGGNGSIDIHSKNLRFVDSTIVTGIDSAVELTTAQAGNITIDTTEATTLRSSSNGQNAILNLTGENITDVLSGSSESDDNPQTTGNTAGNAGNISIDTDTLLAEGNFGIGSLTNGEGNAGNVNINAESISLESSPDDTDGILSGVGSLATGNGGDIQISTQSLFLDRAFISTSTLGAGNAGDITIDAREEIVASNSSSVEAGTFGSGDAGNILFESETANITFENQTTVGTPVASRVEGEALDLPDSSFVGTGKGGSITIEGRNLSATDGSIISTLTGGEVTADGLANAGNIELDISDSIKISGYSTVSSQTIGEGNAGNLIINTGNLAVENSLILTNSIDSGTAGSIDISASQSIDLSGTVLSNENRLPAGLYTIAGASAAGDVTINTPQLRIADGGQIQASTSGAGDGGSINIEANEIQLIGSSEDFPSIIAAFTSGSGTGGIINISAEDLSIADGAAISVGSLEDGNAGEILATVNDSLELENGVISSRSDRSSAGEIAIAAGDIRLRGDSDIQTSVSDGAGGGGNITLTADSIVAFDDSDIFAFAADGVGGNITLDTDAFFATNYSPATLDANPQFLDNNSRVDINASGSVFGIVDLPNVNFLPNSLVELSEDTIDADEVVANSCVVRNEKGGTFIVTGSDGLRSRPGDAAVVDYTTGAIRSIPDSQPQTNTEDSWQPGDPIVEPDKAYRLSNGKLVLSRGCS